MRETSSKKNRARQRWAAVATTIGNVLLKGLVVPLLARLASRVPLWWLAQLARALWMRVGE